MQNAQLLVDAYKKNEQQVTEQLEGLLDAEVGETLTTEEKETLDAFHRAFTWDVEYDFTSWWNAEINYDIESSQSTKSLDEARNFLNGNTDLDEPNVEDWETHQHIEFTGQIDRELSGVEVYNLALKDDLFS